jgi:hypothetical protein
VLLTEVNRQKLSNAVRPDRSTGIARRSGRSNLNIDSIIIELVAGARNYLKLRLSPTGYNVLIKLVAASERGLFRVAA